MSYPIIFYLVMIKIVKIFIIGLLGFSDKGFPLENEFSILEKFNKSVV